MHPAAEDVGCAGKDRTLRLVQQRLGASCRAARNLPGMLTGAKGVGVAITRQQIDPQQRGEGRVVKGVPDADGLPLQPVLAAIGPAVEP